MSAYPTATASLRRQVAARKIGELHRPQLAWLALPSQQDASPFPSPAVGFEDQESAFGSYSVRSRSDGLVGGRLATCGLRRNPAPCAVSVADLRRERSWGTGSVLERRDPFPVRPYVELKKLDW